MPIHILHHLRVIFQRGLRGDDGAVLAILQGLRDVPQFDGPVLGAGRELALVLVAFDAAPRHAVPLAGMTPANGLGIGSDDLILALRGEGAVLGEVPDVDIGAGAAGGDDEVILGM